VEDGHLLSEYVAAEGFSDHGAGSARAVKDQVSPGHTRAHAGVSSQIRKVANHAR